MPMIQDPTFLYQRLTPAGHTTGTVTNSTEYYDLPRNYLHKGLLLVVNRTAETGTCTLDAQVEFYAPASGTWLQLEGAKIVQFADGATGDRYLQVYPGLTGSDADDVVALDTAEGSKCGQYLPPRCRLAVTSGGTSVSNTYQAECWLLP